MATTSRLKGVDSRVVAVLAATGLSVAGLGTGILLVVVAAQVLTAASVTITETLSLVLSLVLVQGVGVLLVAAIYFAVTDRSFGFVGLRTPTLGDFAWVGGGFLLSVLGYVAVAVVMASTGTQSAQNEVVGIVEGNPDLLLWLVPLSFLLIGPGEELLFRGIVQGRLREAFGPALAIGVATFIFVALHYFSLSGSATQRLVYITALVPPALVFAVSYERTNNILVPSLIHGAYNALQFGLLYVALKYGPELQETAAGLL
ncbi:CPBP family intramembrane glutamic endopeptidase [Halomarina litorea]|uniref:CPBP family intramembrane glutamic endopeptidase n=1 Tax=Halomarina litorea TaxID=2961595 RepID=UPI0020C410B1|nr:type II CAAX endopeptidase family protein [Halomarina sp. BCD28]